MGPQTGVTLGRRARHYTLGPMHHLHFIIYLLFLYLFIYLLLLFLSLLACCIVLFPRMWLCVVCVWGYR